MSALDILDTPDTVHTLDTLDNLKALRLLIPLMCCHFYFQLFGGTYFLNRISRGAIIPYK